MAGTMSGGESQAFEDIFRSADTGRDNFLARVFGIFSEDVVRHWCRNPAAKYEDLGRPTVFTPEGGLHTLDFTLRHRQTGKTYASEMKCELAFEGYRYLRLVDCDQLTHHTGAAFARFLELAHPGHDLTVKLAGRPLRIDGAVLVWGATTSEGAEAVRSTIGIAACSRSNRCLAISTDGETPPGPNESVPSTAGPTNSLTTSLDHARDSKAAAHAVRSPRPEIEAAHERSRGVDPRRRVGV